MAILSEQSTYFRMKVDLYCPAKEHQRSYMTSEISMQGLFIVGIPCLKRGTEVEVTFGRRNESGALTLPCEVDMVTLDGAHLKYRNPSSMQLLELKEALWPEWNPDDLLQGVMMLSRWYRSETLADWMRLTSMLGDLEKHITVARMRFRPDATRNPLPRRERKRATQKIQSGAIGYTPHRGDIAPAH